MTGTQERDRTTGQAEERAAEIAAKQYPINLFQRAAYVEGYLARDSEKDAQLEAVLALHEPSAPWRNSPEAVICSECYDRDYPEYYPCPTVRAIEEAGA